MAPSAGCDDDAASTAIHGTLAAAAVILAMFVIAMRVVVMIVIIATIIPVIIPVIVTMITTTAALAASAATARAVIAVTMRFRGRRVLRKARNRPDRHEAQRRYAAHDQRATQ